MANECKIVAISHTINQHFLSCVTGAFHKGGLFFLFFFRIQFECKLLKQSKFCFENMNQLTSLTNNKAQLELMNFGGTCT